MTSAPQVVSQFRCLVQICIAELRADVDRLFDSGWAGPERARALELATALRQACERQGQVQLAALARSLAALIALERDAALAPVRGLRKKFKELLHLLERCLSRQRRTG